MSIAIRVNGRRRSSPAVYPVKGDIIGIDMDGDSADEEYLVLKTVSGSVVEVISKENVAETAFSNNSSNVYSGSLLDIALNTTYYDTLSATAKSAIVDKSFNVDCWANSATSIGAGQYQCVFGDNNTHYNLRLQNATYSDELTRHIYALSFSALIEYLEATPDMTYDNTTINKANMQSVIGNNYQPWMLSAVNGSTNTYFVVRGNDGGVQSNNLSWQYGRVRPAFQIDLSKITWTPIYNMTISGNGDSSYCYVVNTDAQTPQQYYTNGDAFSMSAGETLRCYVSGPSKRVTVNGVTQTLTDNAFEYIVDSNCSIAMSFTINDHSYIDITTT